MVATVELKSEGKLRRCSLEIDDDVGRVRRDVEDHEVKPREDWRDWTRQT
jgi:hypothetical protein